MKIDHHSIFLSIFLLWIFCEHEQKFMHSINVSTVHVLAFIFHWFKQIKSFSKINYVLFLLYLLITSLLQYYVVSLIFLKQYFYFRFILFFCLFYFCYHSVFSLACYLKPVHVETNHSTSSIVLGSSKITC